MSTPAAGSSRACHLLGGAFDLPHAETHTALLPATVAVLSRRAPDRAETLTRALGGADAETAVRALLTDIGATVRLRDIGLPEDKLGVARDLLCGAGPTPGAGMDQAAATELIEAAW